MLKVFIDGSAGTTGLRLRERLLKREDIDLLEIDPALRKDPEETRRLMSEAEVCFLCLPDKAAVEAAALAEGLSCRVIDASTAHRVAPGWAYGFPELSEEHGRAVASGRRVAVPGCHASGFISLVYPLVRAGLVPADYPFTAVSLTGYSGGGKSMIADYEDAERPLSLSSPKEYGLSQAHKHLPEMRAVCGLERAPVFMPIVDDYRAGMLVTVPLHASLLPGLTARSAREALAEHYAGAALVKVREDEPAALHSGDMAGRDDMELFVTGSDERVLLHSRFDNLGKGASGAGIECLNLMLGLDGAFGLIKGE